MDKGCCPIKERLDARVTWRIRDERMNLLAELKEAFDKLSTRRRAKLIAELRQIAAEITEMDKGRSNETT